MRRVVTLCMNEGLLDAMRYAAGNEMGRFALTEKGKKEARLVSDEVVANRVGALDMADCIDNINR